MTTTLTDGVCPMITRLAGLADLQSMREIMELAIKQLQVGFLDEAQIEASRAVTGLDTQWVRDGTYFVVEEAPGALMRCGGWSRRAKLYGGDRSIEPRTPRLLRPSSKAARIRAMYTHSPARRGVGRLLLQVAEEAAKMEGFTSAELMATLSGEPL